MGRGRKCGIAVDAFRIPKRPTILGLILGTLLNAGLARGRADCANIKQEVYQTIEVDFEYKRCRDNKKVAFARTATVKYLSCSEHAQAMSMAVAQRARTSSPSLQRY